MVSQDVANKQETMRESLFPLLALRVMCQNHERVLISPISPICLDPSLDLVKAWTLKIGEIEEIGTLSWFWHITLRANRGNRDSLTVSCLLATSWLTMVSTNKGNRGIGTLSWFWRLILRGNKGNRDPLSVLEESRYVFRNVLTLFGHWLVVASDVMVAIDENIYD